MNWISKLEKKYGKYAIHDLPVYIAIAYAMGFVLNLVMPGAYESLLSLNVGAILHGQVWRIITFVLDPPSTSLLFAFFAIYLYLMIGRSLENAWGAFRFNLFFFSGVLFHVIGAFLAYGITYLIMGQGISFSLGTSYLNASMFFAFAALYPDVELLFFFIIPIKIKWLALIDAGFFAYSIITGIVSGSATGIGQAIAAIVSLANFLIFFRSMQKGKASFNRAEQRRKKVYYDQVKQARSQTDTAGGARNKCFICGCTEITNPEREFRYCSKCSGAKQYCNEHLFTHEHI